MEKFYKIIANVTASEEYFNILCVSNNIDPTLPEEEKLVLISDVLKKILVLHTINPIENYIANQALVQAREQINYIKNLAEEKIKVEVIKE
jgi:hypothetical protein